MTWWLWVESVNSCALPLAAFHDDVIKWQHFPRYWPFVRGIHRSSVNSPQKGQWRGALMFTLISAWINGGVNNREAGDLRRHRAHYDVTVMSLDWFNPWWRHAMETVYSLLTLCEGNPPITDGFPSQRVVNAGSEIFFAVSVNKRLNKPSSCRWFETSWRWSHKTCTWLRCVLYVVVLRHGFFILVDSSYML